MRLLIIAALLCCASAFSAEKVIILYSLPNCAPCRQEKIWLEDLKIKYVEGAGKQPGIEYYPTIIVLIDGKEKFRIIGSKSREELKRLLEN